MWKILQAPAEFIGGRILKSPVEPHKGMCVLSPARPESELQWGMGQGPDRHVFPRQQ